MRAIFKYILVIVTCTILCIQDCKAGPYSTKESELVGNLLLSMQYKDTISYAALFQPFDSLWYKIMTYSGSADDMEAIAHIRQHPEKVQQYDPMFNPSIIYNYYNVLKKGEDSGLHWDRIVLDRFELQRMPLTRDIVGYEKIAVNRFQGYVFIKDMLTRRIFAFTIKEMQNIDGLWYGGQVLNIFEASTVEEYQDKLAAEIRRQKMLAALGLTEKDLALIDSVHQYGAGNGTKAAKDEQDEQDAMNADTDHQFGGLETREVVDRKFFGGTFDNEIPVKLYIRYLKGNCPEGICAWEAIYKFGDQQEYIKLDVSKAPDGRWIFTEDPPIGSMDLTFKNGVFTGNWGSTENQTGYDVRMTQLELSPQKAQELDKIIEGGEFAKGIKKEEDEKKKQYHSTGIDEDSPNGID